MSLLYTSVTIYILSVRTYTLMCPQCQTKSSFRRRVISSIYLMRHRNGPDVTWYAVSHVNENKLRKTTHTQLQSMVSSSA